MFGLKEHEIQEVCAVFNQFNQVNEVILYGSRAKGNFKPGSDIDLTMKGENLNLTVLNEISWSLDDLLLPYMIDLSIFDHIDNKDLLEHIERVGQVFYRRP